MEDQGRPAAQAGLQGRCGKVGGVYEKERDLEPGLKPPLGPDLYVRLEAQSSKYFHIFLRLRFFAFLDLEPD
jgi:hypothetical protein